MSTKLGFTQIDFPLASASGPDMVYGQTPEELEDEEWNLRVALAPPVKDSMTRLLDMMAAWSEKSERDEFPDSAVTREQIAELYQEAGQFAFNEVTAEEKRARIQVFLLERILPTLTL